MNGDRCICCHIATPPDKGLNYYDMKSLNKELLRFYELFSTMTSISRYYAYVETDY